MSQYEAAVIGRIVLDYRPPHCKSPRRLRSSGLPLCVLDGSSLIPVAPLHPDVAAPRGWCPSARRPIRAPDCLCRSPPLRRPRDNASRDRLDHRLRGRL